MPVTTSYPGVYIEELPSLVHSVQAAPTSIAVFVGYTHPFLSKAIPTSGGAPTGAPSPATLCFSFADYQTNFGGFFSSPWQPDYVGHAVYQFFLNGGQQCYVVGLPAMNYYSGGTLGPAVAAAEATIPAGTFSAVLQALQPVGTTAAGGIGMTVTGSNPAVDSKTGDQLLDVVLSYGTTVETYRRVTLAGLQAALASSRLANVTEVTGGASPQWDAASKGQVAFAYAADPPVGDVIGSPDVDFGQVFAANASLDKVPVFNLLLTPGVSDNAVASICVAYAERKRAFYIMDTPRSSPPPGTPVSGYSWTANNLVQAVASDATSNEVTTLVPISINAAVYYPWLQATDPITGQAILSPPSGYVAGMYGQEDTNQGVWKSPAGIETSLLGTAGVDPNGVVTDMQQGVLNLAGPPVNCIRQLPGVGTVIFGARTTAGGDTAYQQWKYVAVRRMALFIEQSLYQSLNWAVFQGNSQPLWDALAQETRAFMLSLFRQGAFAGTTPKDAFLVQCDSTTTTPTDVANGVVNLLVGFAPLVPAEFVVIQIAQLAGQAQS
jgi:hypothetical protein